MLPYDQFELGEDLGSNLKVRSESIGQAIRNPNALNPIATMTSIPRTARKDPTESGMPVNGASSIKTNACITANVELPSTLPHTMAERRTGAAITA